ncbi:hypothetical protein EV182_008700 [Spiromyces aspiralis]|uniref:Uncharacterized protein n=1 Tax=Spiromyces aspiralis TaxID=68401 RepID=A0ACC1H839_9FUNG|nr:hypothetical protein EV182_008700 [Spiromyces aspiralis]
MSTTEPRGPASKSAAISRLTGLLEAEDSDAAAALVQSNDAAADGRKDSDTPNPAEQPDGREEEEEEEEEEVLDLESAPEGFCIECKDQRSLFKCEQCDEEFCEVCFAMLHRTGKRRQHAYTRVRNSSRPAKGASDGAQDSADIDDKQQRDDTDDKDESAMQVEQDSEDLMLKV